MFQRIRTAVDPTDRLVLSVLAASFVLRLAWVLLWADPTEPGDDETYLMLAHQIRTFGPLSSEVSPLPYWPVGYPLVIALITAVAGTTTAVSVLQLVAVMLAGWFLHRLVRAMLGPRTAVVAVVVFAIHPAITGTVAWFGYEPFLLALLTVGVTLVHRGADRRRPVPALGGIATLGAAAALQSKSLLVGVPLLVWSALRLRDRSWVLVAGLVVALALGPAAIVARNHVGTGHAALSTNLGANAVLGNSDVATGRYPEGTDLLDRACGGDWGFNADRTPSQDRALLGCAVDWVVEHPGATAALWPHKLWYFSAPFTGPLSSVSQHGFDPRRALPVSVTEAGWFDAADRAASVAVYVLGSVLLLAGAVRALLGRRTRAGGLLLLLPVAGFVAITLVTFGDPRFRIPVLPFVIALQSYALTWLLPGAGDRDGPQRDERDAAVPTSVSGVTS